MHFAHFLMSNNNICCNYLHQKNNLNLINREYRIVFICDKRYNFLIDSDFNTIYSNLHNHCESL